MGATAQELPWLAEPLEQLKDRASPRSCFHRMLYVVELTKILWLFGVHHSSAFQGTNGIRLRHDLNQSASAATSAICCASQAVFGGHDHSIYELGEVILPQLLLRG